MERTSFRKKSRIRPMRPVGPMVTCCEEGRPHILLQTRTKVLNNDLEEVFRRWYPLFRVQAQAAWPPGCCCSPFSSSKTAPEPAKHRSTKRAATGWVATGSLPSGWSRLPGLPRRVFGLARNRPPAALEGRLAEAGRRLRWETSAAQDRRRNASICSHLGSVLDRRDTSAIRRVRSLALHEEEQFAEGGNGFLQPFRVVRGDCSVDCVVQLDRFFLVLRVHGVQHLSCLFLATIMSRDSFLPTASY